MNRITIAAAISFIERLKRFDITLVEQYIAASSVSLDSTFLFLNSLPLIIICESLIDALVFFPSPFLSKLQIVYTVYMSHPQWELGGCVSFPAVDGTCNLL